MTHVGQGRQKRNRKFDSLFFVVGRRLNEAISICGDAKKAAQRSQSCVMISNFEGVSQSRFESCFSYAQKHPLASFFTRWGRKKNLYRGTDFITAVWCRQRGPWFISDTFWKVRLFAFAVVTVPRHLRLCADGAMSMSQRLSYGKLFFTLPCDQSHARISWYLKISLYPWTPKKGRNAPQPQLWW